MSATSATLDAEWSLLLTACSEIPRQEKIARLRLLLREPIRWKILFDLAARHGTQPLLYQSLVEIGVEIKDAVPREQISAIEQGYQTNLHKALFLSRELIRIVDRMSALGAEVMPYKGLALAELIYGDIALRQPGDIDLLIHPQDLPRIREAVRELGYTPHMIFSKAQERAYLQSGYEYAFDGTAGPNLLEVQWAIHPRFYAIDFDMQDLFRRAIKVTVAGHPMKTPSPEDLLLSSVGARRQACLGTSRLALRHRPADEPANARLELDRISGRSPGNCAHPARHHSPREPAPKRYDPTRNASESARRSRDLGGDNLAGQRNSNPHCERVRIQR